ncbi:MAG: NYN domain-containing protein, partial [Clostridia bacterium]|nr:NYN domain-containing protein [Clostridia bacterium]
MNKIHSNETVIALLIDGDNVHSRYIDVIEKELAIIGNTSYKRLYYTAKCNMPNGWDDVCNAHALTVRQMLPYAKSNGSVKNVADAALIIDAMDILYSGNVNCVCIVASDSDYTTVVKRLRESNISVIGMGAKHTPAAFVKACHEFKYFEDLISKYNADGVAEQLSVEVPSAEAADEEAIVTPVREIENFVVNLLETEDSKMDCGEIKKRICKMWPSFNVKNYGVNKTHKLFAAM